MAMTQAQAVKVLEQFGETLKGDYEAIHGHADNLLLTFLREKGYGRLADAYQKLSEAEGFQCA